jgi:hypothetical protein
MLRIHIQDLHGPSLALTDARGHDMRSWEGPTDWGLFSDVELHHIYRMTISYWFISSVRQGHGRAGNQ